MSNVFHFKYERAKITEVLDKRIFNICECKEKEIGVVRKKLLYLHFDGSQWRILLIAPDLSEFKYLKVH